MFVGILLRLALTTGNFFILLGFLLSSYNTVCRTPAERGEISSAEELEAARKVGMAGDGIKRIPKSRYGSVSTYIYHCHDEADCVRSYEAFNDIPCPVDENVKEKLLSSGAFIFS